MKLRTVFSMLLALSLTACGPTEITSGTRLTYQVEDEGAVSAVADIVVRRLGDAGVDFKLTRKPGAVFDVMVPELSPSELDRVKKIIARPGTLDFRLVAPEELEASERERREELGESYTGPPEGLAWVPPRGDEHDSRSGTDRLVLIRAKPEDRFGSRDIDPDSLVVEMSPVSTSYVIAFAIRKSRAAEFEDFTGRNVKRLLGIIIDGEIESAPFIQERLPGRGQISGGGMSGFSLEEAKDLVTLLRREPLPATIELVAETRIEERKVE